VNIFVFDIETAPDVAGYRALYPALADLPDADVTDAMYAQRRAQVGSDFLPHHLQRIVAISVVLATPERVKVWSLGDVDASEAEIITRFYAGIERYTPILVSWNGSSFDLPILHYRALLHGITAAKYWDVGEQDASFKWNNYLSRYHYRHLDLMDILAGYQTRANAPLHEIASMLGFPGKSEMAGDKVAEYFLTGKFAEIRNYCETDVLNTYLIFLQFEKMRGHISGEALNQLHMRLKDSLQQENKPHLTDFLAAWNAAARIL
jgi:hypothetical protein